MSKQHAPTSVRILSLTLILALLVTVSSLASAQPRAAPTTITELAKLTASDAAEQDRFGWQVAIGGDNVVVTSVSDDDNGENSGSAYLFERDAGGPSNWGQVAKLTASDGAAVDGFGHSVSISGDTVAISAVLDDDLGDSSGSAYLFDRPESGWTDMTETVKLTASDGAAGEYFGWSVSISGDTLIVGAPVHPGGGAAYLFERDEEGPTNWGQVAKLSASDGAAISWFGRTVAISGGTVVVGARADEAHGGGQSGSAYLFEKPTDGWANNTETAKLTTSGASYEDYFAEFAAISGDVVLVSAGGDDAGGLASGAAYLFEKPVSGWVSTTETAKLTASDAAEFDGFGSSVSISGTAVVVGARQDADNGLFSGSAYLFLKPESGWATMTETVKITASDGAEQDYFAWSTAIDGGIVVVGSSADDDDGENSGSAYVYSHFTPVAAVYLPVVLNAAP